jgi:hypothetical protein
MSAWTIPTDLAAFQAEGTDNAAILYKNVRSLGTSLSDTHTRANNLALQVDQLSAQITEGNRQLAEANQRLQQATANPDEAIRRLNETTACLQDTIRDLTLAHEEVNTFESQVTSLQTQLNLAQQAPPAGHQAGPPPPPPPPLNQRSEKMPDPEKFHGDRAKLPDFLTQIRLKLLANSDRFLNENAMMMYIIPRLDGAALRQITTFINGININFASSKALLTYLETSFGDPDPSGTARREIHELKQIKTFPPTSQSSEGSRGS